jgi:Rho GTPase-activating protein 1
MVQDLMHEVSLRSSTNLMDAHNLAIVLCPNLVSGSSPAKDIAICSLPGGPVLHPELSTSAESPPQRQTTLGMIIKLCIQRYYEIFDEVQDRGQALLPARSFTEDDATPSDSSSPHVVGAPLPSKRLSALSHGSSNRDSRGFDDDESIDDTMLVMPVGSTAGPPPSTWGPNAGRPRSLSQARSVHTLNHATKVAGSGQSGQVHRARSTISLEKTSGTVRGKGSVTIGRGTARKASGAGVQALGVTASGFFAPLPSTEERKDGYCVG